MNRYRLLILSLTVLFLPCLLMAEETGVVAVLSSNSGPYREALEGFTSAFGRTVTSFSLSEGDPKIPSGTRVIVAIGSKAALYPHYPSQATLIYCLAPGTKIKPSEHSGPLVKVHTSPSIKLTLSKFKEIQPSLKKL